MSASFSVKERKPKLSAEAGRLADDYIIARKENAARIEKEEDKEVPDRRLPPRCGKCRKLGHIWRGIVGRHNPGLNEKKRKRKFRGSREKTSKILSVIIAIRRDITRLIVQATVADLGFHEGGFVRSGALARPRRFIYLFFLQTTPTSGQNHALLRIEQYPGVELGVCLRFILVACSLEVVYTGKIAITVDTKK